MAEKVSSMRATVSAGLRRDSDPPAAVARRGWRYHHIGVPTDVPRGGEIYLPKFKMHVSGFSSSPYGIEWMRFEPDSPIPELIRTVPHIAFEVDDLDAALAGEEVLCPPGSPSKGVRAAMIIDNGAPVELISFSKKPRGRVPLGDPVDRQGPDCCSAPVSGCRIQEGGGAAGPPVGRRGRRREV
jgi:hypothetical protein